MESLTLALGWMLVHSSWQVAAIAVLLALALHACRGRAAELRYLLACSALTLCLAVPALTFAHVHRPRALDAVPVTDHMTEYRLMTPHTCPPAPQRCQAKPAPVAISGRTQSTSPVLTSLGSVMPYLVAGWFAGVVVLSLGLLSSFFQAERLKRRGCRGIPAAVQTLMDGLGEKLGIRQHVRAFESGLADSPLVIGVLKPVILLPASALSGLSVQQLEGILAHELAHIKRFDYLANLLQSIAETLLFFHPAMWWISGRIRAERENACDDLAIEVTGAPITYARALAQLEALRPRRFALGAADGSLVFRIRRIVGLQDRNARASNWLVNLGTLATLLSLGSVATLPQWVVAQERATQPRTQLWATMYGLTVQLDEDATALEKIPSSGFFILEEREVGQRRKMTVTQEGTGEFRYAYELDGIPTEVSEEALAWYRDAFARSVGFVQLSTPGDLSQLSYRSFVRGDTFYSVAHVYNRSFHDILGLASRRGEIAYRGEFVSSNEPPFEAHAEGSVLNDIGRMTHLAAHDVLAQSTQVQDVNIKLFAHDVLTNFAPTPRMSLAMLELAREMETDQLKAEMLIELAPRLPAGDPRVITAYRGVADSLADEALRGTVSSALP